MVKQRLLERFHLNNGNANCEFIHSYYPPRSYNFTLHTHSTYLQNRPNGVRFNAPAGSSEFAKRWNPQTGDIITFKHHGYLFATKKPKFPTLHRLRSDLQWDDVVHHWKEQKSIFKGFPSPPSLFLLFSPLIISSPLFQISWINSIIKEEQTERILVGC